NVLVKTGKNAESLDVFKRVFQKRAVSVVRFFIQNRENRVFTKEENSSEPFLYKQFEKAQFVNSPAFLIQTYIRHCLESTEEVILFRQIVQDLLSEYMGQEEASSKKKQRKKTLAAQAKDTFSRYFMSRKKRPNDSQPMDAPHQIKETLYTYYTQSTTDLLYLEPVADVVPVPMKMNSLLSLCLGAMGLCLPAGENTIDGVILEPIKG
ncbi:hypothetical protein NERG_02763, partial [Nematocida ausubeli]